MKCGGTSVRGGLARGLLGQRTSDALFELDGQAANAAVPDARFITVLREPVERLVSLYNYRRFRPNVHWPVGMTFDEFLESPWAAEGHNYVRTFCGRADLDPRSDEAVTAAIENLRRFAVVGCTSRLDDLPARFLRSWGSRSSSRGGTARRSGASRSTFPTPTRSRSNARGRSASRTRACTKRCSANQLI